ncbi:permease [Crateriforma conspicua]|uniref:permease n=1 Tax=Crateriforma conspicua TaxID=2527996 RepID=UPI00118CD8F7|nr:permease [Crateriforma conspicua]QDV65175.1 putative permease [Crateriforma conspicua]
MNNPVLNAVFGGLLRMTEALMASAPTLLVGLAVAAILRFYLGANGTRRLFGGDSLRALPQSWAVGMLLPVCSIGVLPILIEMRRAKLKAGALSAFALAAPLFNPLSLLYGVTLSRPYVILMFAVGSLLVVTLVGMFWDRYSAAREREDDSQALASEKDPTDIGVRRLFAVIGYMCRQLVGPVGVWTLVAALGVGLLACFLPWGALQHSINRDDWWAPARMAGVAIPAYATPMLAMSQLGMMFQHANSPGAAFILLVIGAGVNLGTIGWLARHFSNRSVAVWFTCLMVIVVGIAYALNRPLIPPGVTPSDHTHAFDIYTNPIHFLDSNVGAFAREKLAEKFGPVEQICLAIFAAMGLAGAALRLLDRTKGDGTESVSAGSESVDTPPQSTMLGYDRIVSSQVVGGTMIIGLIVISVVMCYSFYPAPEECMEEIRLIRAEAMSAALSGDTEHAKFWVPHWDQWSRRAEVGAFLRRGTITPYQRMQGFLLRKKLDLFEHELEHEHDDPFEIRGFVDDVMATDTRWRTAYREPYGSSDEEVVVNNVVIPSDQDL